MMFEDSRVQKGPGEGKSLVSREWQIATRERKGKKRKGNTWQSTRPLSTSCPLFHHQVSLMVWVALSKWYPDVCGHICQPHCLDPLYCFVKSFTIKVTASNTTIWFPRVTNTSHNRKAIIPSTESYSVLLSVCWECTELGSLYLNFENTSVFFFREMDKLDIRKLNSYFGYLTHGFISVKQCINKLYIYSDVVYLLYLNN